MDTKKLRQKILDLAIRGKLVPQDPNDEPASVLLERIREEKKQMVKEGKLKAKDIKNDTIIFKGEDNLHYEKFQDGTVKCIEDEIPFDIPDTWAWCRIRDICNMSAGKSKSADKISENPFENSYPCFGGNGIRGYVDEYNNDGTYSIVGRQGALCGNVNIASGKFYATEHAVVTYLYSMIDFKWSHYCLEGLNLNRFATGAAQPGLSVANVLNVLLPLPPFNEQCNIGQVVDKALTITDNLGTEKDNLLEIITKTKSKILDLAIRGKLVPQNETDEPAYGLLERIRSEKESLIKQGKLKRDKKESIIYKGDDNSYYELIGNSTKCIDDEIPFEVPNGWSWARGKNIFVPMESRKPTGETFDYIDIDSIDNKNNIVTEPKHLFSSEAPSRASRAVFNGSVVFSTVRPYLKNIAYIDERLENCIASTGFYICTSNGALYPQYMFLLMISHYVVNGLNQYMKGDNSPSINKDDIDNWLFPIPPYNEQIRIQEKVHSCLNNIIEIGANLL